MPRRILESLDILTQGRNVKHGLETRWRETIFFSAQREASDGQMMLLEGMEAHRTQVVWSGHFEDHLPRSVVALLMVVRLEYHQVSVLHNFVVVVAHYSHDLMRRLP